MPDVRAEAYRTSYDDAIEVGDYESPDSVIVATFSVDRYWDGTPTGLVDPLPIRVACWPEDADEPEGGAYLTLEAAEELRAALAAAIEQVRWTRHRRRRQP